MEVIFEIVLYISLSVVVEVFLEQQFFPVVLPQSFDLFFLLFSYASFWNFLLSFTFYSQQIFGLFV